MQYRYHHLSKLPRTTLAILFFLSLFACKMTSALPSDQTLPLFNPHRPDFTCRVEATLVPIVDAQADAWLMEALAMEDPEIIEEDRDYKKIVQLTRQAADRHHWKAMLNLASLYLESRDPQHGVEDAIKLVEQAMQLGIPAAYDRMGTFYLNGVGVRGDTTKAYAFFQKAADMGNPQSMTFLAEKVSAISDHQIEGYWGNIPIATKMLECALGQGFGQAAYVLHSLYALPISPDRTHVTDGTPADKARALKTLHEGVKFGCADCADKLFIEFDHPRLENMLTTAIDKDRGERYDVLGNSLSFNPRRRFPNLDKILPLPPAPLPPWDGKRKTLLDAAMGITAKPLPKKIGAASHYTDRRYVADAFILRHIGDTTTAREAPVPRV